MGWSYSSTKMAEAESEVVTFSATTADRSPQIVRFMAYSITNQVTPRAGTVTGNSIE